MVRKSSKKVEEIDEVQNNKLKELEKKLEEQNEIIKLSNERLANYEKKLKKHSLKGTMTRILFLILIVCSLICLNKVNFVIKRRTKIVEYKDVSKVKNKKIDIFHQDEEEVENIHNASTKLELIDGYGENQPTHPKILNFKKKWHGYKYWMTYSPYPYSDDKKENPHIVASNDLINWEVPDGLKNPIDDTDYDYKHMITYLSDPHLVYNDDKDILECYYRKVNDKDDEMILYRKTSKDGVHWSDREEVLKTQRSKQDYISPAIIYDKGIYKIWYVNKNNVWYAESEDGYNYTKSKRINLTYPINVRTWHLDVIKTENGYEMITVAFVSWNDRARMNLYYFRSNDETSFKDQGIIILRPSLVSWDNQGLYRSSFIYEKGKYYVIYSGISGAFDRGLGLSYGENIENLIGSNLKKKD